MQNKPSKKTIAITSVIAICIAVIMFFLGYGTFYLSLSPAQRETLWFVGMVDKHYYCYDEEKGEVKTFTAEEYLENLSTMVDAYSTYYTREEYTEVISTSKGNRYGLGIYFASNGTTEIIGLANNSPSKKVGVKVGSKVKSITYGETTTSVESFFQLNSALDLIPIATDFTLTVEYGLQTENYILSKQIYIESYAEYFDNKERVAFESDYGEKPTEKKESSDKMATLSENTAYISLSGFESNSAEQFGRLITYAHQKGKTSLILDLRNNGGGYMDVLKKTAEYLIKSDKNINLVALAKDKKGRKTKFNTSKNRYLPFETVVLANDGSASATECLIGAMLHYGTLEESRFIVEKRGNETLAHTYGKGIMQTTYRNIFSWSAVKLTTAYVYWPDRTTSIHGKGIFATQENSVQKADATFDYALDRAVSLLAN